MIVVKKFSIADGNFWVGNQRVIIEPYIRGL